MKKDPYAVGGFRFCPSCGKPVIRKHMFYDLGKQDISEIDLTEVRCSGCDRPWIACPCDSDRIKVEIFQEDWMPGFAAFRDDGSLQENGTAHVVLNVGSLMSMVQTGDAEVSELPYIIAETIMHEVIHVLESWAGAEFSEEKVEALLEKYRKKYAE